MALDIWERYGPAREEEKEDVVPVGHVQNGVTVRVVKKLPCFRSYTNTFHSHSGDLLYIIRLVHRRLHQVLRSWTRDISKLLESHRGNSKSSIWNRGRHLFTSNFTH